MKRTIVLLLLLLPLPACSSFKGPARAPGMKSLSVVEGSISDLHAGSNILVIAPFSRTKNAFYLCRGEDAANFAESFSELGLFATELRFDNDPETLRSELLDKSPAQIRDQLGLEAPPDLLLSGVIRKRQVLFNVFSDVTMNATYLLTFHDLRNGKNIAIEAEVHENFEFVAPAVVQTLADRVGAVAPSSAKR